MGSSVAQHRITELPPVAHFVRSGTQVILQPDAEVAGLIGQYSEGRPSAAPENGQLLREELDCCFVTPLEQLPNMRNVVPDLIICFIVIVTVTVVRLVSNILHESLGLGPGTIPAAIVVDGVAVFREEQTLTLSQLIDRRSKEYSWLIRLSVNTFGYLCVFVPGVLIYKYTRRIKYLERSDKSPFSNVIRFCFGGASDGERADGRGQDKGGKSGNSMRDFILLLWCLFGLMTSYLTWGVLQEKIMTQEYENADKKKAHFKDSQFLVFTNRVLGFMITAVYLTVRKQLKQRAPLYKFSYASFSNIMSAWFQYEALKFVNSPPSAVVFTIIMVLRQAIAILLSCLIYKHSISFLGIVGVMIVFLAIFLRVYCNQRLKAIKRRHAGTTEGSSALVGKPRLNV
ncbi:UDP-galactose transporter [Culex quinquefasciatus]|uniref:Adenosine 3'-phospho 5'-phosphosulfate transporter 1 n=1 Tax=Culex quinquefasciatus TaxID=7176 RepID=B0X939_CULQU|nr:UDP-galactose transporter [Culex quinquefasciatus]|eukprot:XP_001866161.1 UDP-galactose transporter [Culex quinquefasciatus]